LSELLIKIARKPVQVDVSAVRVLFELLGFLLKRMSAPGSGIVSANYSTGGLGVTPLHTSIFQFSIQRFGFPISNRQFPSPSALRLQ
jgi:hypothetical protein